MTVSTDLSSLTDLRPKDIDEALADMRTALERFHKADDKRAIFLRLYYIMTLEVHAAINQLNEYRNNPVFLDPDWIKRLSGIFAGLYFESLSTFDRPESAERAWKTAHRAAASPRTTVVQNALCGIDAHINYDLAHAIALNLIEHDDLDDPARLAMRKFDHDQVNNLLVRSLPYIQDVLARQYGPGIALMDRALGPLDERVSDLGLKYYRERVWADGLAYASAIRRDVEHGPDGQGPAEQVVRNKLNWESQRIAELLTDGSSWRRLLWLPEQTAAAVRALLGLRKSYRRLTLEPEGGVSVSEVLHPFS